MLCIISRGVPARKELLVQGRELLVTRFISADLSDTVNLLSMAEMFNEEDDADFWLPFAENSLGGTTACDSSKKRKAACSGKTKTKCIRWQET